MTTPCVERNTLIIAQPATAGISRNAVKKDEGAGPHPAPSNLSTEAGSPGRCQRGSKFRSAFAPDTADRAPASSRLEHPEHDSGQECKGDDGSKHIEPRSEFHRSSSPANAGRSINRSPRKRVLKMVVGLPGCRQEEIDDALQYSHPNIVRGERATADDACSSQN